MSQKTNPLSLRLQKREGNHHFSSPWFTDVFFSDTFQHESSIRKYIDSLFKETQHSKAFFSAKSSYRKFNVLFSIQDTRAQKKEKQLLFNLKSNLSSNTKKQSLIRKIKKGYSFIKDGTINDSTLFSLIKANYNKQEISYKNENATQHITYDQVKKSTPLFVESFLPVLLPFTGGVCTTFGENKAKGGVKALHPLHDMLSPLVKTKQKKHLENQFFCNFFRKRVRDNFLQFKQNYNLNNIAKFLSPVLLPFTEDFANTSGDSSARRDTNADAMHFVQGKQQQSFIKSCTPVTGGVCTTFGENKAKKGVKVLHPVYDMLSPLVKTKQKKYCANWPISTTNDLASHNVRANISTLQSDYRSLQRSDASLCNNDRLSFRDDALSLLMQQHFVRATENHFQDRIKSRNCFTFCEKIVNGENLKDKENQYTFPTFSKMLISDKNSTSFLHNIKFQTNSFLYTPTLKKAIINFSPIRFVNATQSVSALLDQIVILLEKRVSFREIKSKLFKDIEKNYLIKGVRFSCSGRLGGRSKKAQKAKMQSYQWGETSLNAFSSKVVFANKSAMTSYGKVGVKVWLSFKVDTR